MTTAAAFTATLEMLLTAPDIDQAFDHDNALQARFEQLAQGVAEDAFGCGDETALHAVHLALFRIYDMNVCFPGASMARHQHSVALLRLRKMLEKRWMAHEQPRLDAIASLASADAPLRQQVVEVWQRHASFDTPIFPFMESRSTEADIKRYFSSDCALNVRFYDLIVLALVGARPDTRKEISGNFWDEVGKGGEHAPHVALYEDLLRYFGIEGDTDPSTMTWQALAGYNAMMRLATSREHYLEYVGALAITELADPRQYAMLLRGCRRLGLGRDNPDILRYYAEHVEVDVVHGDGWLDHVVVPLAGDDSERSKRVLAGACHRLATSEDYWNRLLQSMPSQSGLATILAAA